MVVDGEGTLGAKSNDVEDRSENKFVVTWVKLQQQKEEYRCPTVSSVGKGPRGPSATPPYIGLYIGLCPSGPT
jgi:hypothetical protein